MKPLSYASRGARWLMAAGIAVAMLPAMPAHAEDPAAPYVAVENPAFRLDRTGPAINPEPGEVVPFFTKKGIQRGCDYVTYDLRFGARGDPARLGDPGFAEELKQLSMEFRDQLPAGLRIVSFQASGDGTDAAGGPLPAGTVSTTANPNDTATLSDFRLSATDIDGSGEPDARYIDFRITARIDHAAFPAATVVDNQAFIKATREKGPAVEIPSQDPNKPDDGDFRTGEKTSISIDVSDCEPPPPPPGGGEECFKVENGTVDCVPGGGAFIYHMPVGPQMAGKWVQLSTTTPGITIDPNAQIVPPGGGVLDWEITGASPGDVIHIVVTGIETYAGPEEGVGLCCTQTIDIVIPPDLRCPPKERPHLKVEKRADVPRCTPAGGCDFTITVTNVGDAPYHGNIVLDEVTTPGNAAVVSGPNPPWTCMPMTSPMTCEHPVTTLDPGESVDLKLGFAPGPGWQANFIRNCVSIDRRQDGMQNHATPVKRACAEIPICRRGDPNCEPPHEKKADLILKKRARTEFCTADGVCTFIIDVINNGTDTYNGPLTVIDSYPGGVPATSTFGPTPPWNCGPNGPGQFRCDHPGIVLLPGASTPIGVKAILPAGYQPDSIENCARVEAIPDESDLTNNKACATERVRHPNGGKPALRITKECGGSSLAAAGVISCRITVISLGTAAPVGPVRVNDAATLIGSGTPVQIQSVSPDGPEWACGPVPANALSCQIPGAVMTPGTSRHFDVTVAASREFENCAMGSYGPAPGDDIVYPIGKACAKGGGSPDIRVEKTGDRVCYAGEPCTFEITITNDGDNPFSGPVRIGDAIGVEGLGRLDGVAIAEVSPPFGCSPEPTALPISCIANLTLGAGESHVHQVTVVIPDDNRLANYPEQASARNCVAVLSPDTPVRGEGDELSGEPAAPGARGKAYACHPFTIVHEVKKLCSEGFVPNAAGNCVCPEGTTFRNGKCTGETPPPPPPTRQCKLLEGQIRTSDGRCICPRGTELENGACVTIEQPPVRQCKLLPGQIRTENGNCICPRGTELRNGACRKVERQCTLLPGQIRTENGNCICPRGTELRNGACRKVERQCTLLPGQIRTQDGKCICPKGTELRNGACRTIRPPVRECTLLPGQIRTKAGECICPRGTKLIDGACRKPTASCPDGTRLVNGQCVPIQRKVCPEGTTGRFPNCRPVRRKPTIEINPNLLLNPNILQQAPKRQPTSSPLQLKAQ